MTRFLLILSALLLSSVSANLLQPLSDITDAAFKEVSSVVDNVEKVAFHAIFDNCQELKQLLNLAPENIKDHRNVSSLTMELFTKTGRQRFNLTDLSSVTRSELFNPREPVFIYFHGFTESPDRASSKTVIDVYLKKGTGNVLALDSSEVVGLLYLRSSTLVKFIGEATGKALVDMMRAGVDPSAIYLVGHSLGAHMAGFTGKTVLALTGSRVGRITGLDPAGPCFGDVEPSDRLNKNDALYVDVIHTDGHALGLAEEAGHADYYPNRGTEQPGCSLQVCSHDRAWLYYAVSVAITQGFPAVKCNSYKEFQEGNCNYKDISLMGYGSRPGTVGKYYLRTADRFPYVLGINGTKYVDDKGVVGTLRDVMGLL